MNLHITKVFNEIDKNYIIRSLYAY